MGIFSFGSSKKSDDDPQAMIRGSGGNPDERPRWGKITPSELQNHAMGRLRRKLGARKASVVEATLHGSLQESGSQKNIDGRELDEAMDVLEGERFHLDLSKKNLDDTRNILEKEL